MYLNTVVHKKVNKIIHLTTKTSQELAKVQNPICVCVYVCVRVCIYNRLIFIKRASAATTNQLRVNRFRFRFLRISHGKRKEKTPRPYLYLTVCDFAPIRLHTPPPPVQRRGHPTCGGPADLWHQT